MTRPRLGLSDAMYQSSGHGAAPLGEEAAHPLAGHVLDPDLAGGPRGERHRGPAVAEEVGEAAARGHLLGVDAGRDVDEDRVLDEVEERRDVPVGELDELVRHAWRL